MGSSKIGQSPKKPPPELFSVNYRHSTLDDTHLRSTLSLKNYKLQANDGIIGRLSDFILDSESWIIRQLVVKPKRFPFHKEVEIPSSKISSISYEESSIITPLTCDEITHPKDLKEMMEIVH